MCVEKKAGKKFHETYETNKNPVWHTQRLLSFFFFKLRATFFRGDFSGQRAAGAQRVIDRFDGEKQITKCNEST